MGRKLEMALGIIFYMTNFLGKKYDLENLESLF